MSLHCVSLMLFVVVSGVEVYFVFTQFAARYQNNYGNFKSLVSLTLPFLSCGFELVTVRCCVKDQMRFRDCEEMNVNPDDCRCEISVLILLEMK